MRILVIEDDRETRDYLVRGLSQTGHVVDATGNGKDGLFLALDRSFDVMVVDRMLPGLDGLSIIETFRKSNQRTPVLILSALGEVDDRVEGLQRGGDDYLVKPFAFSELVAILNLFDRNHAENRSDGGIQRNRACAIFRVLWRRRKRHSTHPLRTFFSKFGPI